MNGSIWVATHNLSYCAISVLTLMDAARSAFEANAADEPFIKR
jgi:hypothetical protein